MFSPAQHGSSRVARPNRAAYRMVAVIGIASPLITYLIATSPFSYAGKIAGVVAVSVCSAALSVFYISQQNKKGSNDDGSASNGAYRLDAVSDEPALSMSLTDPVTGLPNERALEIVLENQLAESRRQDEARPLGLISLEIRDLAEIGEARGPEISDRVAAFFAENLLLTVRKLDFVARTGEEFYVVLPVVDEAAVVEAVARVAKHFDELNFETEGGEPIPVRPYFGWASYPRDGETADELVRAAMLQKERGKAESLLYDGELHLEYVH